MLSSLRLRAKLLMLALGPILLLTLILSGVSVLQLQDLADQQEAQTRANLIRDRRAELEHYVELARNAIGPIYERSAEGDLQARDQAVAVFERLSYGSEGYFWGYDGQSRRVFQGPRASASAKASRITVTRTASTPFASWSRPGRTAAISSTTASPCRAAMRWCPRWAMRSICPSGTWCSAPR